MDENIKELVHCARVFQIFGIVSQKFNFSRDKNEKLSFVKCCLMRVYSFLVNLGLLYLILAFFTEASENEDDAKLSSKNILSEVLQNVSHFALAIIILLYLVRSIFSTYSFENEFFFNCVKLNEFTKLNFMKIICYQKFQKKFFVVFGFLTFTALSCTIVFFYITYFQSREIMLVIKILMPIFIGSVMNNLRLMFFVQVINFHLEHINCLLVEYLNLEASDIAIKHKFKSSMTTKNYNMQTTRRSDKIKMVMTAYSIAEDNVILFNKSERFTLLISFLNIIIVIISSGYRVLMSAFGKLELSSVSGGSGKHVFLLQIYLGY